MSEKNKQTNIEAAEEGLATSHNAEDLALSDEQQLAKWKGVAHGEQEAYNAARQAVIHHNSAHLCAQQAQAYALIAIAEQLRVANLIAIGNAHETKLVPESKSIDDSGLVVSEKFTQNYRLRPDIAAILGLDGDDHE